MTQKVPSEIRREIEEFLAEEAEILDENRFGEWLDLLSEDVKYEMPVRETIHVNKGTSPPAPPAFALYDDDKGSLTLRADRMMSGVAPTDVPVPVAQRLVTNIRVRTSDVADEYVVRSNFAVFQERRGRHSTTFYGTRIDTLRRTSDGWRIARREVRMAQTILPSTVAIFF